MKKLIVIAGLLFLAGSADAQRNVYKPVKKPKPGTSKTSNARPGMKSATAGKGKARRQQQEGKKFNISLGISLAISNSVTKEYRDATGSGSLTKSATAFGVFVYPKYNFYSTEKYSISVGIPLTLAFSGSASTNSRTGTSGSASFSYDLPLMFDLNGGCMTPQGRYGESRFGYFVGVGFGMQNGDANGYEYSGTGGNFNYESDLKVKSVGPNIHAGGVLRFGSEDKPRFVGFRIGYKFGLNADGHNYITPSVFLNI